MNTFVEALLEALKDTAIVVPIMYLAYLLVGYFSHNNSGKYSRILHHTKKAGPLVGAFLGCIPQCGFSSVMSSLYSKKIITVGTLFAVFIATSDEAVLLMIRKPEAIPNLLVLIAIKLVYAIIIGYAIDLTGNLLLGKFKAKRAKTAKLEQEQAQQSQTPDGETSPQDVAASDDHDHGHEHEHCDCECTHNDQTCHHNHEEDEFMTAGCNHEHKHSDCCAKNIFLDAFKHTLIITAYIFVATLVINIILGYTGDALSGIFTNNVYLQILIACAIGLIPNCSAAILLVDLYLEGVIMFAPLVAGLCAGAGVGLIVLFTANRKQIWKNILITLCLFGFAFLCGLLTSFIPIF